MNRSVFAPSFSAASGEAALLTPGDRVIVAQESAVVYEIVHISQQKAWVRSVRGGSQQIVGMDDLHLIMPSAAGGGSVH